MKDLIKLAFRLGYRHGLERASMSKSAQNQMTRPERERRNQARQLYPGVVQGAPQRGSLGLVTKFDPDSFTPLGGLAKLKERARSFSPVHPPSSSLPDFTPRAIQGYTNPNAGPIPVTGNMYGMTRTNVPDPLIATRSFQHGAGLPVSFVPPVIPRYDPTAETHKVLQDSAGGVNDFFNDIILPMKKKYGGTPGVDYNPEYFVRDFPSTVRPRVPQVKKMKPMWSGYNLGDKVYISPRTDQTKKQKVSTLVHEMLGHLLHRDAFLSGKSGYSQRDLDLLNKAFGWDLDTMRRSYRSGAIGQDTVEHEEGATLKQLQWDLYLRLKNKLGRKPTFEDWERLGESYRNLESFYGSPEQNFPPLWRLADGYVDNSFANGYGSDMFSRREREFLDVHDDPYPSWWQFWRSNEPIRSMPPIEDFSPEQQQLYRDRVYDSYEQRTPSVIDAIFTVAQNGQNQPGYSGFADA